MTEDWTDAVRELYVRDPDMEADEFVRLMDLAARGQRPHHPGLPAYLPLPLETSKRPYDTDSDDPPFWFTLAVLFTLMALAAGVTLAVRFLA